MMIKRTVKGIKIIIPKPLDIRKLPNGNYEIYFTEAF